MASGAEQIDTEIHQVNDISVENKKQIERLMNEVSRFKITRAEKAGYFSQKLKYRSKKVKNVLDKSQFLWYKSDILYRKE